VITDQAAQVEIAAMVLIAPFAMGTYHSAFSTLFDRSHASWVARLPLNYRHCNSSLARRWLGVSTRNCVKQS
jgi:hypothetical protein